MIRKAIIVMLTLAAVGMAAVDLASFRQRASKHGEDWLFLSDGAWCTSRDGVLEIFFSRCPECGSHRAHVATCNLARVLVQFGIPTTRCDLRFGQFQWQVSVSSAMCLYVLSFPTWAVVVLFGAYPTIAFIRGPLRRWRRRRRGLCITCGYDLTGNVTGVCSECGKDI